MTMAEGATPLMIPINAVLTSYTYVGGLALIILNEIIFRSSSKGAEIVSDNGHPTGALSEK